MQLLHPTELCQLGGEWQGLAVQPERPEALRGHKSRLFPRTHVQPPDQGLHMVLCDKGKGKEESEPESCGEMQGAETLQ